MTELEKLIEQKKEIERRIKELKEQPIYFGEDAVIRADKYKRCSGAKEMFRISAKRMSYNDISNQRYISLVDVPMEDKDEAIEYLAMIEQGLAEYLKEKVGTLIENGAVCDISKQEEEQFEKAVQTMKVNQDLTKLKYAVPICDTCVHFVSRKSRCKKKNIPIRENDRMGCGDWSDKKTCANCRDAGWCDGKGVCVSSKAVFMGDNGHCGGWES